MSRRTDELATGRGPKHGGKPGYQGRFARYFQDELSYLREVGTEFSRQDPGRAHFDFANVDDPDVKCLLEGFSFLTARIRQTLDGDLPELTHSLLQIMFPHALRPIPPMTVLQFTPSPGAGAAHIKRGATVDGPRLEGTAPRFTTCHAVDVVPIELGEARLDRDDGRRGALRLDFKAVGDVDLASLELSSLRLYVRGEEEDAGRILSLLRMRAAAVTVTAQGKDGDAAPRTMDASQSLGRVGFDLEAEGDARTELFPWPARGFDGYRLLQEYFSFPKAFNFVDVVLPGGALEGCGEVQGFTLRIAIDDLPADLPRMDESNFALFCTPAVNLFEHDADPIQVDHQRSEFIVRPEGEGRRHFEVHSVASVALLDGARSQIPHFHGFHSSRAAFPGAPLFYETRLRPSTLTADGAGGAASTDTFLTFVADDGVPLGSLPDGELGLDDLLPPESRVSVTLLCSNRHLAERLTPTSITVAGEGVPPSASVRGIEPISRTVPPPLGDGALWKVLSHLSLNQLSLDSVDRLRGLLEVYDAQFQADDRARMRAQKRIEALTKLTQTVETSALRGGAVRVVCTELEVDLAGFLGPGDLDSFGLVLAHFLASYVAMNTLSRLTIRVPATGLELGYPPLMGLETLA